MLVEKKPPKIMGKDRIQLEGRMSGIFEPIWLNCSPEVELWKITKRMICWL